MSQKPVVVKRVKKVVKGGHHGGSWKVAYADFVTAMMAFFLLMWLLSSVNQSERAQIAGYFKRPLKSIFTGGTHSGGDRIVAQSEGSSSEGLLQPGSDSNSVAMEARRLAELHEELEQAVQDNPLLQAFEDQLLFELTDQGLNIQITDQQNRAMFASGSAMLQPYTVGVLKEIARLLNDVPNRIAISGHTDAVPYAGGEAGYSNWELSADRANAARRQLVAGGIQEGKILRVEGVASTNLLDERDPLSYANRRITILLLNRKAEEAYLGPPAPKVLALPSAVPNNEGFEIDEASAR